MALSVILVECDVTSPEGVTSTLRFSDRAVFPMSPLDPDMADVVWDERLIEPPSLKRTLFDDLQTLEPGLGVGTMSLSNGDRALDIYQGHVWGVVRVWRWIYGTPFSEATALMTGPASGTPAYDVQSARPGLVRLILYDYRLELERPIQSATYGGTNDGETVLYDGEAGIKGRLKPLAWGNLLDAHVPGVSVNQAGGAFQLHDGRVVRTLSSSTEMQIFDRGGDAGLEYGGDTSQLPDEFFDGESFLSPDIVYTHSIKGLLRFNANPVGSVAFGYEGAAPDGVYAETPGPIIAQVLARLGVPPERIGASVSAVACDHVVGAYTHDPMTGRELIGWLARSAPMAVLPDRFGVWEAILLAPPAGPPVFTIGPDDFLTLEADEAAPQGGGEFAVGWDRIWTTYRRDNIQIELLGTEAEPRLGETYRYVTVEDAPFKARYPAAWRKVKMDSALRHEADAEALAATLQGLFGLRPDGRARRQWRVTVEMTAETQAVTLGQTVALDVPGYGTEDVYLLIGEEPLRPRRDQMIWTLWG